MHGSYYAQHARARIDELRAEAAHYRLLRNRSARRSARRSAARALLALGSLLSSLGQALGNGDEALDPRGPRNAVGA